MPLETIVLGQVGLGRWGPNILRNLARLPGCRVKVCCDPDQEALGRVAADYPDVRTTADYEQLLLDPELAAIVVSAPARVHHRLAGAALEHGKHVFVEKPLALQVPDAEDLIELARTRDLRLMVGHLLLYHPAIQWLKEAVDTGELGELRYLYSQRLNLGQVRTDENAMWSLAPHDISVALHLLGDGPESVSAQGRDFLRAGIHDLVFLTMHFPHGRLAHCHVSWLDPHKIRQFTVVGSQKMAVFDDVASTEKLRIFDRGVDPSPALRAGIPQPGYPLLHTLRFGDIFSPRIDMREPLYLECQHFVECVRERKRPLTDGEDGLAVLRVLAAGQESLDREGALVRIGEEESRG